MSFLTDIRDKLLPETVKEKIIKHEVKKMVNDKLKLDGELDKHIDAFADKVMDKVDPSTIFKAKDMYDKLKAAESNKDK
ncbi:hypothetical protein PE051_19850 [Enterobacter asburiae]|uniref:hypothetical protein n=1 Tax=Enterobacteriaceae TaxID=543 RepID=UPI001CCE4398|nr:MULTISPECIES: hypothetical protein [Enterobacteriaceae]MCK6919304.1 hypothetical protein [Enterobacter kobei]MCO7418244.1 hypothetical protein [Enterobacter asburiae]MDR5922498.1 hypothetical protein [Escherichia coli]MEB6621612.1 hypothetical protein [Enterobacter roggenkampii]UBM20342.1 hypothetical protein LBF07_07615 [Enterobacter cloacae complex sp. ECL352]